VTSLKHPPKGQIDREEKGDNKKQMGPFLEVSFPILTLMWRTGLRGGLAIPEIRSRHERLLQD